MSCKCDVCGKFRKWETLKLQGVPDSPFGGEDYYYECSVCLQEEGIERWLG